MMFLVGVGVAVGVVLLNMAQPLTNRQMPSNNSTPGSAETGKPLRLTFI